MSYSIGISFSDTTGLTILAALWDGTTIHVTERDLAGTVEDGQGGYYYLASIPDAYQGELKFYTGALDVATDWTGVVIIATANINPQELENADVKVSTLATAAALAAVQAFLDALTQTAGKLWVLDSDGNPLASGGSGGPTLSEIRDAITTDHGDGSYLRNTEPTDAPTLSQILDGITDDHGSGNYIPDSGSGAFTVNVTVTDGTDPLENALVKITDPNGDNPRTDRTLASGIATLGADAATYSIRITKPGYQFAPTTLVVTDDLDIEYSMTAITLPVSSDPLLCLLSGTFIKTDGSPAAGVQIVATLYSSGSTSTTGGQGIVLGPITITLDEDGEVPAETTLVRTDEFTLSGCRWQFTCVEMRLSESSVELAVAGFDLTTLLD